VDVLRAAVSEIEQYERVTLNVQPGISVRGHAVNDVVHLLAELAENATSFSSAETPVVVAGHLLTSGGVLLDISDQGVGMGAEEMAHANWRLDNPPVVDVAVSRRMGLFVVARLAARHGIRVRLRPAPAGGLTALVWLPDEVISHESSTAVPGMRRFEPSAAGTGLAIAGGASSVPAGLNLALNGSMDRGTSPVEQEINAARAPRFASQQPADDIDASGLGPRRVPGAGLHPGNAGWGGAATTSPLPAVGSAAAEAGLASGTDRPEAMSGSQPSVERYSSGPMPTAALTGSAVEFSGAPAPAPSVELGKPAVVGNPGGASRAGDLAESGQGGFAWDGGPGRNGAQGGEALGTAALASSPSGVVLPPAEHVATENRLPIFEAVESDWFRRGRTGVAAVGAGIGGSGGQSAGLGASSESWPSQPAAANAPEPEVTWAASAADQGWEAAAAVSSPSTGGTTSAGLPKRVPQANLVPGTASPEPVTPGPARSAAATRDRFASFQRGVREGRAAVSSDDPQADGDDGSR
jgi:hypothetical protein